jgi:hypothetical protein
MNDLRIVTCPELNLDQTQRVKTDIQPDKTCHICNVPTDYDKKFMMVSKTEWNIARAAEIVSLGLIAYIVYQQYRKLRD